MKRNGWLVLLLSFIEGFAITLNQFTMILAIWFGAVVRIILKPQTTPLINAFFLFGALTGWIVSYVTGAQPFYRWSGPWWIPTGLIIASFIGIPIGLYLDKREKSHKMHTFLNSPDN